MPPEQCDYCRQKVKSQAQYEKNDAKKATEIKLKNTHFYLLLSVCLFYQPVTCHISLIQDLEIKVIQQFMLKNA
jgi:hypothetical protein